MLTLRNVFFTIFVVILLAIILFIFNNCRIPIVYGGRTYDELATAQRTYTATGTIPSQLDTVTTIDSTGTHWTVLYSPTVSSGVSLLLENPAGVEPFTWTLENGSLPPGMQIINGLSVLDTNGNPTGALYSIIAGLPQQTGTYSFDLKVTDDNGNSKILSFTLTIDYPSTIRVCPDGSIPNSPCPPTHSIQIVSGNFQDAVRGQELKEPLTVIVRPAVAGIGIAWKVTAGNGQFKSWVTTTDGSGTAEAEFIAGTNGMDNRIVASLFQGGASQHPIPKVTFEAQGKNPKLLKTNDNQSVVLTSSTKKPLILTVKDRQDQPMQGVKVSWKAIPNSDGTKASIYPDKDRQVVGASFTNAIGEAKAIVGTADTTVGTYTITASLPKYNVAEQFTVNFTKPGFLHANNNVRTLIPGQDVTLQVCYDQTNPNPPPTYITIPVTFSIVYGDGALDPGNPIGTDGITCLGEINYTFGKDAYPDIVSATANGETVYFSMTPPNVEVTRIDFVDNYNIRFNKTEDIPNNEPEWVQEYDPGNDHNYPVAYKINKPVQIKTRIKADVEIVFAKINAEVLNIGAALQKVKRTAVSFLPGGPILEYTLTVEGTTAANISKKDVRWIWKVSDMNGMGGLPKSSVASGQHTVYTLLDTPTAPIIEAWTNVLDHSTSVSWAGEKQTDETATAAIVKKIYESVGYEYDIARGGNTYGKKGTFNLTSFLGHLGDGGAVVCNCYDAGHTLVVFSNALGINSQAIYLASDEPQFYILSSTGAKLPDMNPKTMQKLELLNIIDPIGITAKPTNNIYPQIQNRERGIESDIRSGGFNNHLYVVLNGKVYDPTLKVTNDSQKAGAEEFSGDWWKYELELPAGMNEDEYYDRLFDNGPLWTYTYDADNDGKKEKTRRDNTPTKIPIPITIN